MSNKIWLVTEEGGHCCGDFSIEAAFTSEELARAYVASKWEGCYVMPAIEDYEIDEPDKLLVALEFLDRMKTDEQAD